MLLGGSTSASPRDIFRKADLFCCWAGPRAPKILQTSLEKADYDVVMRVDEHRSYRHFCIVSP